MPGDSTKATALEPNFAPPAVAPATPSRWATSFAAVVRGGNNSQPETPVTPMITDDSKERIAATPDLTELSSENLPFQPVEVLSATASPSNTTVSNDTESPSPSVSEPSSPSLNFMMDFIPVVESKALPKHQLFQDSHFHQHINALKASISDPPYNTVLDKALCLVGSQTDSMVDSLLNSGKRGATLHINYAKDVDFVMFYQVEPEAQQLLAYQKILDFYRTIIHDNSIRNIATAMSDNSVWIQYQTRGIGTLPSDITLHFSTDSIQQQIEKLMQARLLTTKATTINLEICRAYYYPGGMTFTNPSSRLTAKDYGYALFVLLQAPTTPLAWQFKDKIKNFFNAIIEGSATEMQVSAVQYLHSLWKKKYAQLPLLVALQMAFYPLYRQCNVRVENDSMLSVFLLNPVRKPKAATSLFKATEFPKLSPEKALPFPMKPTQSSTTWAKLLFSQDASRPDSIAPTP